MTVLQELPRRRREDRSVGESVEGCHGRSIRASAAKPAILAIPAGHANGFMTPHRDDAILQFFRRRPSRKASTTIFATTPARMRNARRTLSAGGDRIR